MMKQVTAILLGAGQRGAEAYASYALDYSNELKFVGVAEPRKDRREEFARLHGISKENAVESDMELLNRPKMADCVLICTQDQMHYEALKLAAEKGYHILCEKPISPVKSELEEIKKLAEEASCVMVGRCADYALEDYPNVVSVFITANDDDKLKRLQDLYKVDASKAKDIMIKTDKQRASYYNYYSNKKWSDPRSYDLCLNSSVTGPEGAVDVILNFAKVKQTWRKQK